MNEGNKTRLIRKKKSGKLMVKIPPEEAMQLQAGSYTVQINDLRRVYQATQNGDKEMLEIDFNLPNGIRVTKKIFVSWHEGSPFSELVKISGGQYGEDFDLCECIGQKIGIDLKKQGDFVNIYHFF